MERIEVQSVSHSAPAERSELARIACREILSRAQALPCEAEKLVPASAAVANIKNFAAKLGA
jgi:hypothetical protein